MNESEYLQHAARVYDAWNRQDVEAVVACYTPDLRYRDPNTRGTVEGAEAFARYLTKLFDAWEMHWATREAFMIADRDGAAVLWRATLRRKDGTDQVEIDGMDLVVLEGDRIARNEVYFDRALLAPLLAAPAAATA